jgi:hypothetical protein
MNTRSRLRSVVPAAFIGWIAGWLLIMPFQLFEAARNAGLSTASTSPGLFAKLLGISLVLWTVLSLAVSCYCCCMFLSPVIWITPPEGITAHRRLWVVSNIAFGASLIGLRAHIWTAFNHDGVGLGNFWVWALFAAVFFGIAAECYFRIIRKVLANESTRTSLTQPR